MKKLMFVLSIAVLLTLVLSANRDSNEDSELRNSVNFSSEIKTRSFNASDTVRYYKRLIPSGGPEGRPVVLYLHGGGQGLGVLTSPGVGEQLQQLSEREQLVVLVPNGTDLETGSFYDAEDERRGIRNKQRWNDDRLEDQPIVEKVDDVSFLSALVENTHQELGTDRSKTYVLGPSNGGYMTQKLLLEKPELFAAGASIIATVPVANIEKNAAPTPILFWLGTDDPVVVYEGTELGLSGPESIRWWANLNGHEGEREVEQVSEPDTEGCYTTVQKYEGDYPVYGYVTHGGGHVLSSIDHQISESRLMDMFIGRQCSDIEGVEVVWDFLSQHKLSIE